MKMKEKLIRKNNHKNQDHMQYRKHTIIVLMLAGCFLLMLSINDTPREEESSTGFKNVTRLYKFDERDKVYNYSDKIVITPEVLYIINKTFYYTENETVMLLEHKMIGDKIRIFNYTIPKMESAKDSVSFFHPFGFDMTIHSHPYDCGPSTNDIQVPDSIIGIYCPDKKTIAFYIKETKETLYYEIK